MFLECWYVLVQVEKAGDCNLDLVVSQVWEGRPQQVGHKVLDVTHVGCCHTVTGSYKQDKDL